MQHLGVSQAKLEIGFHYYHVETAKYPMLTKKDTFHRFVETLVKKKEPCYAISPHLDDAILSAGALLSQLSAAGVPVSVISIFTEGGPGPCTRITRRYMKRSGDSNGATYFQKRRAEDQQACAILGVQSLHMGLVDAGWRKTANPLRRGLGYVLPEMGAMYPFGGRTRRIVRAEYGLVEEIASRLSAVIGLHRPAPLFCPVVVGRHVDHMLARKAVQRCFPDQQIIFWEDFPYNTWSRVKQHSLGRHTERVELQPRQWDTSKKRAAIAAYASQIQANFPNAVVPIVAERYYIHPKTWKYLDEAGA